MLWLDETSIEYTSKNGLVGVFDELMMIILYYFPLKESCVLTEIYVNSRACTQSSIVFFSAFWTNEFI